MVKEIEVDRDTFVERRGYLILRNEVISSDYKDTWKEFTAEVFNKSGDLLNINVVPRSNNLRIELPDYKDYEPEYGGYIMIVFSATGDPLEPEEINQTPARVVFSVDREDLAEVTISEEDLKNGGGYVRKSGVELPETYKGNLDKLTVTVYNEDDDILESTIGSVRAFYMQIQFPEYTEYDSEGGALTVVFSFVSAEDENALESDVIDVADEATDEVTDEAQESKSDKSDSEKSEDVVETDEDDEIADTDLVTDKVADEVEDDSEESSDTDQDEKSEDFEKESEDEIVADDVDADEEVQDDKEKDFEEKVSSENDTEDDSEI